jgi:hypothetical protein
MSEKENTMSEKEKEHVMSQHILGRLLRKAIVGGALSVLLAATTMAAAAAPVSGPGFDRSNFGAVVKALNDDTPRAPMAERDPTDDGNIIIECVAFAFAGAPAADAYEHTLNGLPISMPQHPLGPTKCSPPDLR